MTEMEAKMKLMLTYHKESINSVLASQALAFKAAQEGLIKEIAYKHSEAFKDAFDIGKTQCKQVKALAETVFNISNKIDLLEVGQKCLIDAAKKGEIVAMNVQEKKKSRKVFVSRDNLFLNKHQVGEK